jgi:ABC-2 type transport system permease protein
MMSRIREILGYRNVLREFIQRDLKLRYEGAALGYLWTLFDPLLMTGVYFVVFGLIGRFNIEDYILFLILGMLPWVWFSGTVTAGTRSLTNHAGIMSKVYLPRELAPLSVVGARTFEYVASLPILIVVALFTMRGPNWMIVLVPVAWILQLSLHVGASLALSATNVLVRDVERILNVSLRVAFYASPILYPLAEAQDRLPDLLAAAFWLNPMTGIMEMYRAPFYPDRFPGFGHFWVSVVECLLILVIGWHLFARLEPKVLKEL